MKYITTIEDQPHTIEIDDKAQLSIDGKPVEYDLQPSPDPTLFSLLIGNKSYELRISPDEDGYTVQLHGDSLDVRVEDERTHRLGRACVVNWLLAPVRLTSKLPCLEWSLIY